MIDSVDTPTLTLLTLIASLIFQYFREERRRKWDLEDRAQVAQALREETQATAASLKQVTLQTAETLMTTTGASIAILNEQVAQGTQHAKDAYHEANSVNNKIADLQKELLAQRKDGKS